MLTARKPELLAIEGDSLGAKLMRRRRELRLRRVDAARELGVSWKTLMWWEQNVRAPTDRMYPSIIAYLGGEPWAMPQTLPAKLQSERRRRGLSVKRAAVLIGMDENTLLKLERGEWPLTRALHQRIEGFIACSRSASELNLSSS